MFGLIERFSEDIDLSIRRDYLGAVGERDPEQAGISNNKRAERVKALREICRVAVHEQMLPAILASLQTHLGAPTGDASWRLESDPGEPGTLLFTYPSVQTVAAVPAYIRPQVKLEMGAGSAPYPIGRHPVRAYAAETFPSVFTEPEVIVTALEAERTFWEKATLLHAECHRPASSNAPARLSRHYYDLIRLAQQPVGERALTDPALRERVVRHKSTYFASGWAYYDTAQPGTFRLVPGQERLSTLRLDYRQMQDMIFAHPPTFDEILDVIVRLEQRINNGP